MLLTWLVAKSLNLTYIVLQWNAIKMIGLYAWHSTEKKLCQPKEVIINAFIYLSFGQPLQGATKADIPHKHNKPRSGQ